MPNLISRDSFNFGDISIVSGDEDLLKEIEENNPAAEALLSGFKASLAVGKRPAALIYRNPHKFADLRMAMIDARNAVAVASACYGWIGTIGQPNAFALRYTDHFDFYPRWPTTDGKRLVYQGPAISLVSNVASFSGTTHPYLSVTNFSQPAFDDDLLPSITKAWRRIHVTGRASRQDHRLFRALSVAYEACRVPQAMDNPFYDHGKHCSLWVSAFETLAHSGTWAGHTQVVTLIGKRHLADPRLSRKVCMKVSMKGGKGGKPKIAPLNVAQRLYTRLYAARNKFLHGNKISLRDFVPKGLGEGIRLLDTAPLVFHTALEAFLLLKPLPPPKDGAEEIHRILRYKALEDGFVRALGFEPRGC